MSETIPLGCPDCGAKWQEATGPLGELDGKRFECPTCGRGYIAHLEITLKFSRH